MAVSEGLQDPVDVHQYAAQKKESKLDVQGSDMHS